MLRRDIPGVLAAKWLELSLSLLEVSIVPSPLADCCCRRASIMCRCCSRTLMLRCSCSFMAGSCVTKPGERHARPTSWMPRPSLAVRGRAVPGVVEFAAPPLDKSSLLGRCRGVGSGEPGSFFTMIFGGGAARRDLDRQDWLAMLLARLRKAYCLQKPGRSENSQTRGGGLCGGRLCSTARTVAA